MKDCILLLEGVVQGLQLCYPGSRVMHGVFPAVDSKADAAARARLRSTWRFDVELTLLQAAKGRHMLVKQLTNVDDEEEALYNARDFVDFAKGLTRLCELLAEDPVRVRVVTDERQRTVSDRQAELAESIKQLQPFQAYYRTSGGQYKLDVLPGVTFTERNPDRISAIRERSKLAYGVSLEEPPPPTGVLLNNPLQPPIGRRSRG